ncbi:MAG: hypothetical protein LBG64_01555 [Pseudomonadales bacterium]|nr:hypothetical protein [Pseudomonadales bacterium]
MKVIFSQPHPTQELESHHHIEEESSLRASETSVANQNIDEAVEIQQKTAPAQAPELPTELNNAKNNFSLAFNTYLKNYLLEKQYRATSASTSYEIDDLALGVGKFYEKIRKVIDWKEENALRRGVILRGLKRHLVNEIYGFINSKNQIDLKAMAETMLLELMHSGYFDNSRISDKKVEDINQILNKVLRILSNQKKSSGKRKIKDRLKFRTWLLEVAACEIEHSLAPSHKDEAIVGLMKDVLQKRIKIKPENSISPQKLDLLVDICVRKSLYGADNSWLTFNLIKLHYPIWLQPGDMSNADLVQLTKQIYYQTSGLINDKQHLKVLSVTNRYDAAYRLVDDLLTNLDPERELDLIALAQKLTDENTTKALINKLYHDRRATLKSRLFRTAIWSTLSILIAGAATLLFVEIPVAHLIGEGFTAWAIAVDIAAPSLLMFFLVLMIRPPKKSNYPVVEGEILKIIYKQDMEDTYLINFELSKTDKVLRNVFIVISAIFGLIGASAFAWLFISVGLPWTSVIICTIYTMMVFFAYNSIKQNAQEITIKEHSGLLYLLADTMAFPLAKVGRWFARKWKEYNIVAVFFSAIIDMPFSAIIAFVEDWRNFIKERNSELTK